MAKQEQKIWRTVYSDLWTNLSLFFLILYAYTRMSAVDQKRLFVSLQKLGEKKATDVTVEETIQEQTDELAKKLEKFAQVAINEQQVKITLPSPVLFERGKADLKQEAKNVLSEVAKTLKNIPNEVVVEGHTCNLPITGGEFKSNWDLSAARAFAVVRYFTEKEGLDNERFSALGYGEFKPAFPNDTEENRAKNRRIEINIIKK